MKSQLVELKPRNVVVVEKKFEIHTNGQDNAYPTRMERIINASPTATSCAKVMAKFIIGTGFNYEFPENTFIGRNQDGKVSPVQVLKECAHSIARHNAFALHVNYNLIGKIVSVTAIPYKYLRYGLADSSGYKGKILSCENWDYSRGKRIKPEDIEVFDIFNPLAEVVQAQIKAAGGIFKYKGQILIVKMESGVYPLSPIDSAQDDADTEYQLQLYKNRTTRKGFVGKKIITTNEFSKDDERLEFQADLKKIQGMDSEGDILHFEVDATSDDKTKKIDILGLDTDIKPDLFINWEISLSNSVRRCFNSVPKVLMDVMDGAMFGTSGESFKMAQVYYNTQTSEERATLSATFKTIFEYYHQPVNPANDWTIGELELIKSSNSEEAQKTLIQNAQSELRGSVGGVTSLIAIQASVASGVTSYESGVSMLKYIYGFEEIVAREILGQPKTIA